MALIAPPSNDEVIIDLNPVINLDNYTLQDLLKLRADIERRLPAKNLRDLSLEKELVLQFLASQELQNRVLSDTTIPPNQAAQTANSTAGILQQLVRLQSEVHTSERLKDIENKLIQALNGLPDEQQHAFFAVYEAILGVENGQ